MYPKCFFCGSINVVRNGLRGRAQRYKCKDRVIPNTNNGLEGIFSDIKSKVRVHSGSPRARLLPRHHPKYLIDTLRCKPSTPFV